MKKTRKILAMAACAILLVCISVGATVAYLTSTDNVTNTFTVGKVEITLDEALVNGNGDPVKATGEGDNRTEEIVEDPADATRVSGNNYKLFPGHSYTKDPTVTVKAGSADSYVRMLVTVSFKQPLKDDVLDMDINGIFTGYNSIWKRTGYQVTADEKGNTVITYEYRYTPIAPATDVDAKLAPLFTGVEIPSGWNNADLAKFGEFSIDIVAQAIQADGFKDADKAWEAFDKQHA